MRNPNALIFMPSQYGRYLSAEHVTLGLVTLLLSWSDAKLTLNVIGQGAHEANPIMDMALSHSDGVFVAAKIWLTFVGILVLWLACVTDRGCRLSLWSLRGLCLAYAGLMLWHAHVLGVLL